MNANLYAINLQDHDQLQILKKLKLIIKLNVDELK